MALSILRSYLNNTTDIASNKSRLRSVHRSRTHSSLTAIGMVDVGVFAQFSKGFPMYGLLNGRQMEHSWGPRVFLPEAWVEQLRDVCFPQTPLGTEDTVFSDTRRAADGVVFDFEIKRNYSLGCEDLVDSEIISRFWIEKGGRKRRNSMYFFLAQLIFSPGP